MPEDLSSVPTVGGFFSTASESVRKGGSNDAVKMPAAKLKAETSTLRVTTAIGCASACKFQYCFYEYVALAVCDVA